LKTFIAFGLVVLATSCSSKNSVFYNESVPVPDRLVIASNSAGQYGIVMYDISGNFLEVLHDYVPENLSPRGLAAIDSRSFVIATDGVDQIHKYTLGSGISPDVTSTALTGNIFQMRRHPSLGTFVIATDTIESFDDNGNRIGAPRIPTTVGGCTLATPRGMAFLSSGYLAVVSTGNDSLNIYDISDPINPLCIASNTTLGNVDPVAVIAHSDGFLYVATQGDDRIYRFAGTGVGAATVVFNNQGIIDNPTALVEMPDGSILVASDATDSLVRITTAGALVGLTNFISDMFTNSVSDMIILPGDP